MNCREAYGIPASNGILFDHERPLREKRSLRARSPVQSPTTTSDCKRRRISAISTPSEIGDTLAIVEGMWRIVQQEKGDDYVLAAGVTHAVRSFVEKAFAHIDKQSEFADASIFLAKNHSDEGVVKHRYRG